MHVRVIALALPLVLGIAACKTSSTQGRSETASAEPTQSSPDQSTASTTTTPPPSTTTTPPPQAGADASASGTVGGEGTTAGGSMQGGVSADTSGTASGSAEVTPHSDDQTVTGKVTSISESSVAIQSDMGEEKLLEIVPETLVKIDGQDASRMDLKEGQEVRASFNQVDGRDVAVQIEAQETLAPTDTGTMPGAPTDPGSTGTMPDSPTDPGSTGTMPGGPTDPGSTGTMPGESTGTDTGSTTEPGTTPDAPAGPYTK
jgi:Cu/Ag efflux protein CusF